MAVPRSAPSKRWAISFGAPIEINGPPIPKSPTAAKRTISSSASPRATPEAPMISAAISNAIRTPNRSSNMPQGIAAAI
jgi:hypothetical protein